MTIEKLQEIDFEKLDGLVPAVIQDSKTRQVLMLGFMASSNRLKSRATPIILAPARDSSIAIASPIPREAPVTRIVLFLRSILLNRIRLDMCHHALVVNLIVSLQFVAGI